MPAPEMTKTTTTSPTHCAVSDEDVKTALTHTGPLGKIVVGTESGLTGLTDCDADTFIVVSPDGETLTLVNARTLKPHLLPRGTTYMQVVKLACLDSPKVVSETTFTWPEYRHAMKELYYGNPVVRAALQASPSPATKPVTLTRQDVGALVVDIPVGCHLTFTLHVVTLKKAGTFIDPVVHVSMNKKRVTMSYKSETLGKFSGDCPARLGEHERNVQIFHFDAVEGVPDSINISASVWDNPRQIGARKTLEQVIQGVNLNEVMTCYIAVGVSNDRGNDSGSRVDVSQKDYSDTSLYGIIPFTNAVKQGKAGYSCHLVQVLLTKVDKRQVSLVAKQHWHPLGIPNTQLSSCDEGATSVNHEAMLTLEERTNPAYRPLQKVVEKYGSNFKSRTSVTLHPIVKNGEPRIVVQNQEPGLMIISATGTVAESSFPVPPSVCDLAWASISMIHANGSVVPVSMGGSLELFKKIATPGTDNLTILVMLAWLAPGADLKALPPLELILHKIEALKSKLTPVDLESDAVLALSKMHAELQQMVETGKKTGKGELYVVGECKSLLRRMLTTCKEVGVLAEEGTLSGCVQPQEWLNLCQFIGTFENPDFVRWLQVSPTTLSGYDWEAERKELEKVKKKAGSYAEVLRLIGIAITSKVPPEDGYLTFLFGKLGLLDSSLVDTYDNTKIGDFIHELVELFCGLRYYVRCGTWKYAQLLALRNGMQCLWFIFMQRVTGKAWTPNTQYAHVNDTEVPVGSLDVWLSPKTPSFSNESPLCEGMPPVVYNMDFEIMDDALLNHHTAFAHTGSMSTLNAFEARKQIRENRWMDTTAQFVKFLIQHVKDQQAMLAEKCMATRAINIPSTAAMNDALPQEGCGEQTLESFMHFLRNTDPKIEEKEVMPGGHLACSLTGSAWIPLSDTLLECADHMHDALNAAGVWYSSDVRAFVKTMTAPGGLPFTKTNLAMILSFMSTLKTIETNDRKILAALTVAIIASMGSPGKELVKTLQTFNVEEVGVTFLPKQAKAFIKFAQATAASVESAVALMNAAYLLRGAEDNVPTLKSIRESFRTALKAELAEPNGIIEQMYKLKENVSLAKQAFETSTREMEAWQKNTASAEVKVDLCGVCTHLVNGQICPYTDAPGMCKYENKLKVLQDLKPCLACEVVGCPSRLLHGLCSDCLKCDPVQGATDQKIWNVWKSQHPPTEITQGSLISPPFFKEDPMVNQPAVSFVLDLHPVNKTNTKILGAYLDNAASNAKGNPKPEALKEMTKMLKTGLFPDNKKPWQKPNKLAKRYKDLCTWVFQATDICPISSGSVTPDNLKKVVNLFEKSNEEYPDAMHREPYQFAVNGNYARACTLRKETLLQIRSILYDNTLDTNLIIMKSEDLKAHGDARFQDKVADTKARLENQATKHAASTQTFHDAHERLDVVAALKLEAGKTELPPVERVSIDNYTQHCAICLETPDNGSAGMSIFAPCAHRAACHDCAQFLYNKSPPDNNCPICRSPIDSVMTQVFDI